MIVHSDSKVNVQGRSRSSKREHSCMAQQNGDRAVSIMPRPSRSTVWVVPVYSQAQHSIPPWNEVQAEYLQRRSFIFLLKFIYTSLICTGLHPSKQEQKANIFPIERMHIWIPTYLWLECSLQNESSQPCLQRGEDTHKSAVSLLEWLGCHQWWLCVSGKLFCSWKGEHLVFTNIHIHLYPL